MESAQPVVQARRAAFGQQRVLGRDHSRHRPAGPDRRGKPGVGSDATLTPRFDGAYTSSLTFITGSVPEIEQDGYFVANAPVELELKDRFRVQAGMINLFDKEYLIQGNASRGTLGYAEKIYARPQNWYVQVSADF